MSFLVSLGFAGCSFKLFVQLFRIPDFSQVPSILESAGYVRDPSFERTACEHEAKNENRQQLLGCC